MTRKLIGGALFACAAASTACAPPKVLISNSVQSKYVLQQADSAQNGKRVFNFIVRMCDGEDGRSSNCKDSIVLDNVLANSIY